MKKRIFSLLMALAMTGGIVSVPSYALEVEADTTVLFEAPPIVAATVAGDPLEIEEVGTLDYDQDTAIPCYVVIIPEGTTQVAITYPKHEEPGSITEEESHGITDKESGLSPQVCYKQLEDGAIGEKIVFECEIAEDRSSVSMPLFFEVYNSDTDELTEVSFIGGEYVVAVENTEENSSAPVAFFYFEMTAESPEEEGGEAVCGHYETTIYCGYIADTKTHTETEICNLCKEQLRDTYVADCVDRDCNGNCDDCEGALPVEEVTEEIGSEPVGDQAGSIDTLVAIEEPLFLNDVEVQPGDVNDDGSVNARDLIYLRKYLDGKSAKINEANADVDSNGQVNESDVETLRRKLVE